MNVARIVTDGLEDVINGTEYPKGPFDHDPGRRVVDQLYEVRASLAGNDRNCLGAVESEWERFYRSHGFTVRVDLKIDARKAFTSPLECLRYVDDMTQILVEGGFEIMERISPTGSRESWREITVDDLLAILRGERTPVTKYISSMNPNFHPCVDIGD